ncbi:unnamed protein product [Microthlaspi erraticum]|uniref:TIR domain-containing protein n=1 Tax=Microthlaspi erraticum TaxID=1685480 RepID=A0A6D2HFH3_9BRAS|nr:unnamed protein product [Microthlaspi erraticum]
MEVNRSGSLDISGRRESVAGAVLKILFSIHVWLRYIKKEPASSSIDILSNAIVIDTFFNLSYTLNSLMASSSSFHIKRYHVFPSFHGPDVRRGFLSHLHNHFKSKGITTFKDQEMERGPTIELNSSKP